MEIAKTRDLMAEFLCSESDYQSCEYEAYYVTACRSEYNAETAAEVCKYREAYSSEADEYYDCEYAAFNAEQTGDETYCKRLERKRHCRRYRYP